MTRDPFKVHDDGKVPWYGLRVHPPTWEWLVLWEVFATVVVVLFIARVVYALLLTG